MLTFIRGFHTVWSWNVVLSCWTDRDKLWRHRTAPIWTFRSLQFIPFTICSIKFSVSMIWNVHKSYLISEKAQTWVFFLFVTCCSHPSNNWRCMLALNLHDHEWRLYNIIRNISSLRSFKNFLILTAPLPPLREVLSWSLTWVPSKCLATLHLRKTITLLVLAPTNFVFTMLPSIL